VIELPATSEGEVGLLLEPTIQLPSEEILEKVYCEDGMIILKGILTISDMTLRNGIVCPRVRSNCGIW
jgi:hypothetical protein